MTNKIELLKKDILEKKFGKKLHAGYDPDEVDYFFDKVIEWLDKISAAFQSEKNNSANLMSKITVLEKELASKDDYIKLLKTENDELKKDGYQNYRRNAEFTEIKNSVSNYADLSKKVEEMNKMLKKITQK
ncbi:MAG: DivIVA domain-containing protein [Mycoplasmataceae bacterium]|jgi:DivIVA domain-containing protein|nr:DivIVA domain-containing protein [Mycoplasmataceae bacterium]